MKRRELVKNRKLKSSLSNIMGFNEVMNENEMKCFIYRHTKHILFTVIWCQTHGKGPL